MMQLDDITSLGNSWVIHPSKKRRINAVKEDVLIMIIIVIFFIACSNRWSSYTIGVFVFLGLYSAVMLYGSIKRLINPPASITVSSKGVTIPNGIFIQWQEIEYIRFKYYPYPAAPDLRIKIKNGQIVEFSNWDWYMSKKKLVQLFETFAGRKLLR